MKKEIFLFSKCKLFLLELYKVHHQVDIVHVPDGCLTINSGITNHISHVSTYPSIHLEL